MWAVNKDSSTFADGDPVYWSAAGSPVVGTASTGAATSTAAGNLLMGQAVGAAASGDQYVYVLTDPSKDNALAYSATGPSTAVTNTTTETLFDKSVTIPGGSLRAGDVIRVRAQGIATATNSTDTLAAKLYLGGLAGTLVATTGALDVANNDTFLIDAEIVVRDAGATGHVVAAGLTNIGTPGTATVKAFNLAQTQVDTTAAQVIGVSATWSVANAGDSCRLDVLDVQILRK